MRRDGCPAVSKMLEASLRLLFSTADLSLVKSYCTRQWTKILANRVSVQVCCMCVVLGVCVFVVCVVRVFACGLL